MEELKLDIGCGGRGSMFSGFIGIDIWPKPEEPRNKQAEYLRRDFIGSIFDRSNRRYDDAIANYVIETFSKPKHPSMKAAWDWFMIQPEAKERIKHTWRKSGYIHSKYFLPDSIKPGTFDEIVCFHIIEHLTYGEGQVMLRRAHSLLKPGAKMYVSCPNFELNAKLYLAAKQGDEYAIGYWDRKYPKTGKPYYKGDTFADKFMYQIREATHVWQYDQESLINAALKAGCKNVEAMPWKHEWNRRREYEGEEVGIIVTK